MPINVYIDEEAAVNSTKTGVGYFTSRLIAELEGNAGLSVYPYRIGGNSGLSSKLLLKTYRLFRYAKIDLPLKFSGKFKDKSVIIGANYLIPPISSCVTIPVVHDLCFVDHPEWVQPRNAYVLGSMLPKTLKRSSGLIVISQFTADRVRSVYEYEKPILVVDIPPSAKVQGAQKPNIELGDSGYFLFIGTIEPRKNIATLLDAYEKLSHGQQDKFKLILAGKPGWDPMVLDRIRSSTNKNIIYLDYVTDEEKNWLYTNATATVIPSHYEGFGMMTLESISAGAPVIVSDIPPQREMLGNSGLYFEPNDPQALTNYMSSMMDAKYRETALNKQSSILNRHTWADTGESVAKFIKQIGATK